MESDDIVDRLAAVAHELGRLEALRALAQRNGDSAEVRQLDGEIGQLSKVRDDLRNLVKGVAIAPEPEVRKARTSEHADGTWWYGQSQACQERLRATVTAL
jgi:hypothetical protein